MNEFNFIHGDCLEILKDPKYKGHFDLIFTSPPYNLGNTHHTGDNRFQPYPDDMPEVDYQAQQVKFLDLCHEVLSDTGNMIYNHKNRIRNKQTISPLSWIFKSKLILKQEICWLNGGQNLDKCRFYPMTERLYWLAKQPDTDVFINHHNLTDMINHNSVGTSAEHPRSFPLPLVANIVQSFRPMRVLDPYMGSGTTALACHGLGRVEFTGIEIDKKYLGIAKKRVEDYCDNLFKV